MTDFKILAQIVNIFLERSRISSAFLQESFEAAYPKRVNPYLYLANFFQNLRGQPGRLPNLCQICANTQANPLEQKTRCLLKGIFSLLLCNPYCVILRKVGLLV